jgi:hypothetical protein
MSSWFGRWFAYGLGRAAGKAIFDENDGNDGERRAPAEPIRQQTEEEIREAERRYDEEAKRYAAEDEAARAAKRQQR